MKKIGLVILLCVLIAGFFVFDLHHILTLEGIQGSLEQFQSWRTSSPLLAVGAFFGIYVLVTALSLPGAAVMTLIGVALFGFLWGTVIISFASSIGASTTSCC